MAGDRRKKLRLATIVYWVLLLYIVAALVWWAISLLQQAETIYQLKKDTVTLVDASHPSDIPNDLHTIEDQRRRNVWKFIGEGTTFLILILLGAAFVYRSVRRQFLLHLQQQNFVMAVTHELKTPIAVSKLNLETLLKYDLDGTKREKLLHTTLQETLRLDSLINNILVSSQLEDNTHTITKEEINLSDIVKAVINQFTIRYPLRKLVTEIDTDVDMKGDAVLLKLLISNLIENAQKYSPPETTISIRLNKKDMVVLEVADEGIGIPDDEKQNIFKKFYRIGSEKTRKTQGTGLGLYICKKIAEDHNGQVIVKDNHPQGSKFIVQLPG